MDPNTRLVSQRKGNLIVELTFEFSVMAIKFTTVLEEKRRFVIANQLTRSAISIGANVREAQNAESNADFIHKIKIAAKEADETEYYLELCEHLADYPDVIVLRSRLTSIKKVLSKIIGTSKRNIKYRT